MSELGGKRARRRRLLGSLLAGAWFACGAVQAADGMPPTLVVVGDHAPPFRLFGQGAPSGWYFDLVRMLGQRVGFTATFVDVPPARALALMRTGDADLMVGPNRTPAREAFLYYLQPALPPADKVFYVLPGARPVTRYDDLRERLVGVERGKVYFDPFDTDTSLLKDVSDSYDVAFRKLLLKRIDTVLAPESEADYLLRASHLQLEKSPYRVEGRPSHLAMSRLSRYRSLLPVLEAALRKLLDDGDIERLRDRYR